MLAPVEGFELVGADLAREFFVTFLNKESNNHAPVADGEGEDDAGQFPVGEEGCFGRGSFLQGEKRKRAEEEGRQEEAGHIED